MTDYMFEVYYGYVDPNGKLCQSDRYASGICGERFQAEEEANEWARTIENPIIRYYERREIK